MSSLNKFKYSLPESSEEYPVSIETGINDFIGHDAFVVWEDGQFHDEKEAVFCLPQDGVLIHVRRSLWQGNGEQHRSISFKEFASWVDIYRPKSLKDDIEHIQRLVNGLALVQQLDRDYHEGGAE